MLEETKQLLKDILKDIRKVRDDLVAQSNPHYQDLTNIIYKWETKIATDGMGKKDFLEEAEKEKKELEESYQESVRQAKERS
jgi:sensor domain CHASE-containing protein